MRFLLALAVIASPAAGLSGWASAEEDRYGPPPVAIPAAARATDAAATPVKTENYGGPFLSWASKGAPSQPPVAPRAPPVRAAILTQPRPVAAPLAIAQAPRRQVAVLAPVPPEPSPTASPLPPPPPPLAVAKPPPAAAPAPVFASAAPPPPAAQAAAPAVAPSAGGPPSLPPTKTRYYSVLRDYGLKPDPIEAPKHQSLVLIGPADDAQSAKADDGDSDADDATSDTHKGKPKASTSDLY
jgi:hypothetical protein